MGMRSKLMIDVTALTTPQIADIAAHVRGLQDGPETYPVPSHGWTCFHCGETFRTIAGARLHFGTPAERRPVCVESVAMEAGR